MWLVRFNYANRNTECVIVILVALCLYKVNSQTARIVGGYPTTIDKYPILAQLLRDKDGDFVQHCAGVIVTTRHIISTAHCFQFDSGINYTQPKYWKVRVGSTFRNGGGSLYKLKKIIPHEDFNNVYYINDLAVLVMEKAIATNANVRQSTLSQKGVHVKPNSVCVIAGWGAREIGGLQPDQLHFTYVFIISRPECERKYKSKQSRIIEGMICAGLTDQGGLDACIGDSGGPMLYKGIVIGLVSFGFSCGHRYYPGVYTNVSYYADWINRTVITN